MSVTSSKTANGQPASAAERIQNHLGQGTEYLRQGAGKIRLPEFIMFFLMIFGEAVPGVGLPYHQVVIIVIVLYALIKQPVYELGKFQNLAFATFAALGYLAFVSLTHESSSGAFDWQRRLLRLLLATILIWIIASGRIHIRSAIAGYVTALLVNVPLYYAGLTPDNYKGYLTGHLLDKNVSGLAYCIFGLLALTLARRRAEIILTIIVFAAILWLTGSRTSMAAFAMGITWIVLAKRLPVWGRLVLGLLIYLALGILTEDYSQSSRFGDRAGSDWFRAQIDAASQVKVENTGIFGRGLGEAYVYLHHDNKVWLFHNSYWSALVEGGWPWMLLVVGITVFCLVRPFSNASRWSRDEVYIQGAGIALLVCAQRLGEVFYTWMWAVCVGYAIRAIIISRAVGTIHEHPGDKDGIDGRIPLTKKTTLLTPPAAGTLEVTR